MLPKICQTLLSAEKPSISKIYPAVATKPVTDDTPRICWSMIFLLASPSGWSLC